jgi:hypothetical protein
MNALRFTLLIAAATIVSTPSAQAYSQKEADVLLTVSFAAATAGQKNRKGAEAYCRQAKATLTTKPEDAYLFSHIERCLGAAADAVGDTKSACKHYKQALDIWQRTPPPNDHPQSVASRTQLRDSMIRYRAASCPPRR